MDFSSAGSNAEITVQKVYAFEDNIIAEDYPFQLDQYGGYYMLSIAGE